MPTELSLKAYYFYMMMYKLVFLITTRCLSGIINRLVSWDITLAIFPFILKIGEAKPLASVLSRI